MAAKPPNDRTTITVSLSARAELVLLALLAVLAVAVAAPLLR